MARHVVLLALLVVACSGPGSAAPRETSVTLYMQNASREDVWVAAWPLTDRHPADSFPRGTGVRCYRVETGSQLAMLDRAPRDGPASVRRVLAETHGEQLGDPRIAWAVVGPSGEVTNGEGVPSWWSDEPQQCGPGSAAVAGARFPPGSPGARRSLPAGG